MPSKLEQSLTGPEKSREDVSLTALTYPRMRELLRRKIISNFWYDGVIDPERAPFRPSYEVIRGEGASLNMPLAASWMSSGPSADPDDTNVIAFPSEADRTFTAFMQKMGVLGKHAFLPTFYDFPRLAEEENKPICNVDDLPAAWDPWSANSADMMRVVNTKKYLKDLSSYAAPYRTVDLRSTTVADFEEFGGRVYVKKNNTENTGDGVLICNTAAEYEALVHELKAEADAHQGGAYPLDYEIVLQGKIDGVNRSFQFLMTPGSNDVNVLTVSKQFVEEDGKTYAGNENPPLNLEQIDPQVALMMKDMALRLRGLDPYTFGFVVSDYFETDREPLTFDPGLRATGNTGTVLARMFVEAETRGRYWSNLFFVPSRKPNTSFEQYIRPVDKLVTVDSAVREGVCVMPWGYNHKQGNGLFIAIAEAKESLQTIVEETTKLLASP